MSNPNAESGTALSWKDRLFEPVDASSVVFFRISFGLLMCIAVLDFFEPGKIEQYYLAPSVLFKYYGFSWVEPWPLFGMKMHFVGLAICALGIAFGLWYRLAASLFCLGYLYIFLLDEAAYNNHDYLICILAALLAIVPAHRTYSLDALRHKTWRRETLPAWCLRLLQFQIAIPYTLGGFAKLTYDWVVRGEPIGLWLRTVDGAEGSFDMAWFREPWAGHAFAWGGLVFDLALVPLLIWRRTRKWAFLAAVAFHLSNSQMFNIGIFPWLMICATTIFFEPDWARRFGLLGRRVPQTKTSNKGKKNSTKSSHDGSATKGSAVEASETPATARNWIVALLAIWMAIQVLVPQRHFLYPGNVDWTEEGNRFAWRMKLRHKEGYVNFAVVDKSTGQTTLFKDFTNVLTRRQQRHLVHDPDMIRQFAHSLKARLADMGQGNIEVRALTKIALNGRKPAPLVDPEIDLAAVPRRLLSAPWIVPFNHLETLPDD